MDFWNTFFMGLAACLLLVPVMLLLHPIYNYGREHNTWWWNFIMRGDGPLLGSWSERVAFFQERHAVIYGTQDPRKIGISAPMSSISIYWEEHTHIPEGIPPGWWRLWNRERKNLALVVRQSIYADGSTADRVWWKIFLGDLWPEFTTFTKSACYRMIEWEDLSRMGLTPTFDHYEIMGLEGWADSVDEAKTEVERQIKYIWKNLPVIMPEERETIQ